MNNAVAEMVRHKIDIMGVNKKKEPGNRKCIVDNHEVYHSGNENNKHICRCRCNIYRCITQIAG